MEPRGTALSLAALKVLSLSSSQYFEAGTSLWLLALATWPLAGAPFRIVSAVSTASVCLRIRVLMTSSLISPSCLRSSLSCCFYCCSVFTLPAEGVSPFSSALGERTHGGVCSISLRLIFGPRGESGGTRVCLARMHFILPASLAPGSPAVVAGFLCGTSLRCARAYYFGWNSLPAFARGTSCL